MNGKTLALVVGSVCLPLAAVAQTTSNQPAQPAPETTLARVGHYISDSALTTKVKASLLADKGLSGSDISVETTNGVVTLSGTAENDAQVKLAEQEVRSLKGVKDVRNEVKVQGSAGAK